MIVPQKLIEEFVNELFNQPIREPCRCRKFMHVYSDNFFWNRYACGGWFFDAEAVERGT